MESGCSAEMSGCHGHYTPKNMAVGPHAMCSDIMVLLRTGQSSEDLYSATLASVIEHIRLLESEIVSRDELLQSQATTPLKAPLRHERDLAVQDLKNHKSIFAPVRRLPNDVLLRIFQMSIDGKVDPDVKTTPWLLGYICHHWRALSRSLWTNIFLVSLRSHLSSGQRNLRKHLLSLSGDLPLRMDVMIIHIHHHSTGIPGQVCPGDDRDIIWDDIALHSHRWSHITLSIQGGPLSAFQNFSRKLPLLRSLSLSASGLTNYHIGRLFPSAPLLQDLTFDGTIVLWRELARAMPLSQLVKLSVKVTMHRLDDPSPDFYTCMKEATMLENLEFSVSRDKDHVVQTSTPSNSQLLPTFVHNKIQNLKLDSDILSILDRCSIPNLKEIYISGKHRNYLAGPEVEYGVGPLLRFVERSECSVEAFSCYDFKPVPLSEFNGLWKQWSSSLTKLAMFVTSATRVDAVRELTFEEGKPSILPNLQHLTLFALEGVSIFKDDSLLKMASSRLTRCPGSFTTLAIRIGTYNGKVLSQEIITQMKRLRTEMRAEGVCVKLYLAQNLLDYFRDYFETDERFTKFVEERKA
ncbi:hypothetical protein EV421DRAFT_2039625 [Armillaria borealis]|uniref:F-box domain-containing protein n=1 Tax=Armillaria borealis TaxID=47425 RepID=A0AA39MHF5_9AGAR|nr:hypothetical protein EV421DRAFT_2039625 [Armillaria borealis]